MAPSLVKAIGSAVAILPALASASNKVYKVSEVYDSSNFFDKFDFVTETDANGGYVQYQDQNAAEQLGLVAYEDGEMYIGVEHGAGSVYATTAAGRKSVRLESKKVYNQGLVIADFSYLPKPTCGSWPAFWFFGEPWPTKGEIDLYENWNDLTFNRHTAHVDSPDVVGECVIEQDDMTSIIDSANCYDHADGQWDYQGCSASEYTSTFGSSSGGVYAMEWTSEYLKIWDWERASAPLDVKSGSPKPSDAWGTPAYVIKQCNIDKAFKDMKMVLNVDFCGVAAQTDKWGASCSLATTFDTCAGYVGSSPEDFADTYFKVKDIKFFDLTEEEDTASSSTSSAASSTSSLASTSSTISTTSSLAASNGSSTVSVASSTSSVEVASSSAASSSVTSTVTTSTQDPLDTSISSFPTFGHFTNTSLNAYPTATIETSELPTTTSAPEYTTSTIYSTDIHTITSCPPSVTNCPLGSVTTEIISVSVTVCPVTKTATTGPVTTPTTTSTANAKPTTTTAPEAPEGGFTTSTISVTKVYTITECPASVTNCPVGDVTTEVSVTTTVCPVGSSETTGTQLTTTPTTAPTIAPTEAPNTSNPISTPIVSTQPTASGGSVESTTTLDQTTTSTSTTIVQVTVTIARPSSSSLPTLVSSPSSSSPSSAIAIPSTSTSSSSEEVVYVTATVVPVPTSSEEAVASSIAPTIKVVPTGGFTNSTTNTYPTAVAPPMGTATGSVVNSGSSSGSGSSSSSESIVEISGAVQTSASIVLMAVAGFFFFVM